jgi:hypothetical protein
VKVSVNGRTCILDDISVSTKSGRSFLNRGTENRLLGRIGGDKEEILY